MIIIRSDSKAAVVATAFVFASLAGAQCPAPAWSSLNQLPGVNGIVRAVTTWDPDGAGPLQPVLVAGGQFTIAGSVAGVNGIAWHDGVSWHPFGTGMTGWSANYVNALTVFNGYLIAGGSFTTAGGVAAANIAGWDGTAWQALGSGPGWIVDALTVYNGEIIAGGAGGVSHFSAATFSWVPLGAGPVNTRSLAVYGTDLFAGGNGTGVKKWNGTAWQPITASNITVNALTLWNGLLVAGGNFMQIGGVNAFRVATWNGSAWAPIGSGIGSGVALALTVQNGTLVAGGNFGVQAFDGVTWSPVGAGPSTFYAVYALTPWNSELVAGGNFGSGGTAPTPGIARLVGGTWTSFGTGLSSYVLAFTEFGGDLIAAGDAALPGGNWAERAVFRVTASGFQPVTAPLSSQVLAMTVYNGEIVAGGGFITAGAATVNGIARWNGTSWVPFGLGMNHAVRALAVYNGDLIAAGNFTVAGAVGTNHIARWDGSAWQPLAGGIDQAVETLAVYNGELYAGGVFAYADGVLSYHIARWNGTAWNAVGLGLGEFPADAVHALAVHNGELIAGGSFHLSGLQYLENVARWNGLVWQPLASGTGLVRSLASWGSNLVAGIDGGFTQWDGSSWQTIGTADGSANAMTVYGGALFAGGGFYSIDGVCSPFLTKYGSPTPSLGFSQPGGAGAGVLVTNHSLIPGHEYFNVASLNPCAGGVGTGPYGGLCFNDVTDLVWQLTLPVGSAPFHFVAASPDASFGPFSLPFGLTVESLAVDVTGGVLGCISPVGAYTVF